MSLRQPDLDRYWSALGASNPAVQSLEGTGIAAFDNNLVSIQFDSLAAEPKAAPSVTQRTSFKPDI